MMLAVAQRLREVCTSLRRKFHGGSCLTSLHSDVACFAGRAQVRMDSKWHINAREKAISRANDRVDDEVTGSTSLV